MRQAILFCKHAFIFYECFKLAQRCHNVYGTIKMKKWFKKQQAAATRKVLFTVVSKASE